MAAIQFGLDCDDQCQRKAIDQARQVLAAIPVTPVEAGGVIVYNITVVIGNNNPIVGDKAIEFEQEKDRRRRY